MWTIAKVACLAVLSAIAMGCAVPARMHVAPPSDLRAVALEDPVFYRDFKYRWADGQYRLVERLPAYTEPDATIFVPFLRQELQKALAENGLPVVTDSVGTPYRIHLHVVAPPYAFGGNVFVALFVRVVRVGPGRSGAAPNGAPRGELVVESTTAYTTGFFGNRTGAAARKTLRLLAEALVRELKAGEVRSGGKLYFIVPGDADGNTPAAAPKLP
ncbi:MAG: hypothetical protein Q8R35_01420 [bacterium]|nr:hypothetical protein [bacterium]